MIGDWKLSKKDIDYWLNNHEISLEEIPNKVKVISFKNNTSLPMYSFTLTMQDDKGVFKIIATGDFGDIVLTPTWNPVYKAGYQNMSLSYFMEKISSVSYDSQLVYNKEIVDRDIDKYKQSLVEDYECDLKNNPDLETFIDTVADILGDSTHYSDAHETLTLREDTQDIYTYPSENGFSEDALEDLMNVGLRPRHDIQLVFAALRMLNCKPKGKRRDVFYLLCDKGYINTAVNPIITQNEILNY